MSFRPHFGQITILSLSFVTFQVSRFHVSHLTYETFKLGLQNTLNMSKMTRVYFGVLQSLLPQTLFWNLSHNYFSNDIKNLRTYPEREQEHPWRNQCVDECNGQEATLSLNTYIFLKF